MLEARELTIRAGARTLVQRLSLAVAPGEFVSILGRNGSGKTLTLHTLAGLRPPGEGDVLLDGSSIGKRSRRAVARRLGLLAQDLDAGFPSSVLEMTLVGRYPHLPFLAWEGAQDRQIARDALQRLGLEGFEGRRVDTLSGGELRRAALAALLAQEPACFLLDEPTNHLDPQHQLAILELFRALTRAGVAVVATLHDPSLAARFADRALLLFGDGTWRAGPSTETLTGESLSELYCTPMLEASVGGHRIFSNA